MPHPDTSLSTLRPDLASSMLEFDLDADRQGYIAGRVAPVIEVAKQSGNFGKIPIEQLLKTGDTHRAPGAGYGRGEFQFTPATFACEEHGWEEPVDDRQAQMYREYFDAELIATARARAMVLRNAEIRMAAAIFNATTWASYTAAITNEWDDATNAVPLTDVETAVQAVYGQCGMWPNALVINRKVFRNLRNCDQIIGRIKYAGITDPRAGAISVAAMAQAFDLPYLIVAGGTKDTTLEGQTSTPGPIWSDEYAMICRVAETQDPQEPCIARTFHWGEDGSIIGGLVESYRDERVRGDVVRCRHDVDEIVMYVECGYLLSNVTT